MKQDNTEKFLAAFVGMGLMFLSTTPASAQQGAFTSLFSGVVPPSSSQTASREDEEAQRASRAAEEPVRTFGIGPSKLIAPTTSRASSDVKGSEAFPYRDPPAGTLLKYTHSPNPRINPRLGESVVFQSLAGTRIGGGFDYPSPEAVTIDPRDVLDYKARIIANPSSIFPASR